MAVAQVRCQGQGVYWPARVLLMLTGLTSLNYAYALEPKDVFAKASVSVVVVYAKSKAGASQGSGVALSGDTVATNCHLVVDSPNVTVKVGDRSVPASVTARDRQKDVCLLTLSGVALIPAAVASPDSASPGSRVYSIGSPRGLSLSISEGLVSGIRESRRGKVIQTSAPVSPGSSGGGLFNDAGALVGLTTYSLVDGQNLNFAIPASVAQGLLAEAKRVKSKEEALAKETLAVEKAVETPSEPLLAAMKSATAGAIAAAKNDAAPPKPQFETMEQRLAYLRWLGELTKRLKATGNAESMDRLDFLETVWYESVRAGLDPALVLAVIQVSSNFRRYAINPSGARGYMQVSPRWTETIGDGDAQRLFHPQTNIRYGCVVLRHYVDIERGDVFMALGRYFRNSTASSATSGDAASEKFSNLVFTSQRRWTYP